MSDSEEIAAKIAEMGNLIRATESRFAEMKCDLARQISQAAGKIEELAQRQRTEMIPLIEEHAALERGLRRVNAEADACAAELQADLRRLRTPTFSLMENLVAELPAERRPILRRVLAGKGMRASLMLVKSPSAPTLGVLCLSDSVGTGRSHLTLVADSKCTKFGLACFCKSCNIFGWRETDGEEARQAKIQEVAQAILDSCKAEGIDRLYMRYARLAVGIAGMLEGIALVEGCEPYSLHRGEGIYIDLDRIYGANTRETMPFEVHWVDD